ncbi:MAG: hypothetical protein IJ289_02555 [Clostridia bacterium]|nr:hypothetical protein [Clostridia bacterium]
MVINMRFVADHDLHIHSTVSPCCHDENQTPEAILSYAKDNNLKKICLTNHLWDETVKSEAEWHDGQRFCCVKSVLPLPQDKDVRFLFGAETDMDYNFVLGISKERYDAFDFVVIPTTHLHLAGNTVRTKLQTPEEATEHWIARLEALLKMDLPWHKTGIAHLTCGHIFKGSVPDVIKLLPDEKLYEIFTDCAKKGVGIELNMKTLSLSDEAKGIMLRPYHIAKDCGCKFYLGSDSHTVKALGTAKENFEDIITSLDLKEADKFPFAKSE